MGETILKRRIAVRLVSEGMTTPSARWVGDGARSSDVGAGADDLLDSDVHARDDNE